MSKLAAMMIISLLLPSCNNKLSHSAKSLSPRCLAATENITSRRLKMLSDQVLLRQFNSKAPKISQLRASKSGPGTDNWPSLADLAPATWLEFQPEPGCRTNQNHQYPSLPAANAKVQQFENDQLVPLELELAHTKMRLDQVKQDLAKYPRSPGPIN